MHETNEMSFKTIDDLGDVWGKTALVRADLNVPMAGGRVTDDSRIRAAVPTIQALLDKGARVAVMSHFGRPKGHYVPELSLKPLTEPLAQALGAPVAFAEDCIGPAAETTLQNGAAVTLLENLRFHEGEEANEAGFVGALATLGHVYVNDAFSAAHRAHASTEGLAHRLPAAAGRSMESEIAALEMALSRPEHPVVALVGGAKVSTKLTVLSNLARKVDHLIIGGGMANTFLAAQGIDVKASLCERDLIETARAIAATADRVGCRLHLPRDAAVARVLKTGADYRIAAVDALEDGEMILDLGPTTVEALGAIVDEAKTMVWNGPLGAFEVPPFDQATLTLARRAGERSRSGHLMSVAGGGDTVAALAQAGVKDAFSHISTAGGAFLEWMEGRVLPGVAVLQR